MLKKLFKYEFKNFYVFLAIFYSIALVFALFTRIFSIFDNSFVIDFIYHFCIGTTISMCFSIVINNLMRLWSSFRESFYGDSSYLTHTLPVKRETVFLSKILFSIASIFVSVIVVVISLFIALYSKESFDMLKMILEKTTTSFDISIVGFIVIIGLLLFSQFMFIMQSGYLGMILGHKNNDKKMGLSVLFGFLIYLGFQIVTVLFVFIISLFNSAIYNSLFSSSGVVEFWVLKFTIILMIILYVIYNLLVYFISCKLLKKGVNVD